MNPDYNIDQRRGEPLPGAWRPKPTSSEYFSSDASAVYRDSRYDYVGVYDEKPERSLVGSYDRFNGNQPVFPPMEERQVLAGGESSSRKRPMHDSSSSMYQSKISRSHHDARSSVMIPSYRFSGDSSEILQEESRKCIAEMSQEIAILDNSQIPEIQFLAHTRRLLNEEVNKITTNMNPDWLDVESTKSSIKVTKRVLLPRTRPGSNIVGRLMGVGGSTLRKLCQTYKCHISICGAGSRKNPKEEAELLNSGEARYNHLACPLHAEVSTTGPPHLAYTRLGQILSLLHKIITVEERFEHDGLVFETSNNNYTRRRDETDESYGDGGDQYENRRHGSNYRGRGGRGGRGSYSQSRRSQSPQQQYNTSWRNNGADSTKDDSGSSGDARHSPKSSSTPTRGRGGRGGFVPRGRGGFVPRVRQE